MQVNNFNNIFFLRKRGQADNVFFFKFIINRHPYIVIYILLFINLLEYIVQYFYCLMPFFTCIYYCIKYRVRPSLSPASFMRDYFIHICVHLFASRGGRVHIEAALATFVRSQTTCVGVVGGGDKSKQGVSVHALGAAQ